MNREKIKHLYKALNCTNTDIAKCLGCAQSSISRVKSGRRDYTPSSRPVINFAEGVYIFADKNNSLTVLGDLCSCQALDRDALTSALVDWLFDGDVENAQTRAKAKIYKRRQKTIAFGKRLNAVMSLLELSNIRLAKKINIDASIISRFRSGVRTPHPPVSEILARTLLEQALREDKICELSKISEITKDVLSDSGNAFAAFTAWLYSADDPLETSSIDTLLDNLDSFDARPALGKERDMPQISSFVTEEVLNSKEEIYWGKEGLRQAVIRFLGSAAKEGGELWLYSDEDMDWMVGDKDFFAKWFSLMVACIKAGVKIKIIHNVERGVSEMISAVQSWLPLYMSGLIESYICRRSADARFSHTIFLRQDKDCVFASHIKDSEATGRYEYIKDKRTLDLLYDEYGYFLKQCAPLVEIHFEDYILDTDIYAGYDNDYVLLSSLSLATMPEEVLRRVLSRNKVKKEDRERIESFYKMQKRTMENGVKKGAIREFTVMPSDDDVFGGKARINLPLSLYSKELFYTREDYADHVKKIIKIHEDNANYHLYLLPQMPFDNLQIINSGGSIAVMRSQKPFAAFVFSEPLLVHGFKGYFNDLKTKFACDRNEVRERLKRFI